MELFLDKCIWTAEILEVFIPVKYFLHISEGLRLAEEKSLLYF